MNKDNYYLHDFPVLYMANGSFSEQEKKRLKVLDTGVAQDEFTAIMTGLESGACTISTHGIVRSESEKYWIVFFGLPKVIVKFLQSTEA